MSPRSSSAPSNPQLSSLGSSRASIATAEGALPLPEERSPSAAAFAYASIPMKWVGPLRIRGPILQEELSVPLATFETPLWPSTARGARVSCLTHGVEVTVSDDSMTRSIIVETDSAVSTAAVIASFLKRRAEVEKVVEGTSRFCRLADIHTELVGRLAYLRFSFSTADAAGHNMATIASDRLGMWLAEQYPNLRYLSVSGNLCVDKKVSAANGLLGRGKRVIAEITIPRALCESQLRTTPERIVELNTKKNFVGSILAGGVRSANAHFANMLLALYLATGQDAANIVEGSQGITVAECTNDELYFSITIPNVILGTVGGLKRPAEDTTHGDAHDPTAFIHENLRRLGCFESAVPGSNARRLAAIVGATVLCGELSLLAAQTNPGELARSHRLFERSRKRTGS